MGAHPKRIEAFLREFLKVRGERKWKDSIPILVAGAAIERAGKHSDALSFYDAVLADRPASQLETECRRRWLVVKRRQIEYERGRGGSVDAQKKESELRERVQRWHIGDGSQEPQFPHLVDIDSETRGAAPSDFPKVRPLSRAIGGEVAGLKATPSLGTNDAPALVANSPAGGGPEASPMAAPLDVRLGSFRIKLERSRGECVLRNSETDDAMRIKVGERGVKGTLDTVQDGDTWTVDGWPLLIRIEPDGVVSISVPNQGIDVRITL